MFSRLTRRAQCFILAVSLLAGGVALFFAGRLTVPPSYPDFIVGSLAWTGKTKFQDLIAVPVLTGVFMAVLLLLLRIVPGGRVAPSMVGEAAPSPLSSLSPRLFPRMSGLAREEWITQGLYWLVPVAALLGAGWMGRHQDVMAALLAVSGGICVLAATLLTACQRGGAPVRALYASLAVVAAGLLSLMPLEYALLRNRLFGQGVAVPLWWVYLGIGLAMAVILPLMLWRPARWPARLPVLLLLAQIGAPLLMLSLLPATFRQPDGTLASYAVQPLKLPLLVGLFILLGMADVLRRFWQRSRYSTLHLLSPLAFYAVFFALTKGITALPHVPGDDYHFGEWMLGTWFVQGAIPYVDYVLPHGLADDVLAWFMSYIFLDGTAAAHAEGFRIAYALLGLVAFFAARNAFNSIFWAGLVVFLPGLQLNSLLILAYLTTLFNPKYQENQSLWLGLYILLSPFLFLLHPPLALLVAAVGIAGLCKMARFVQNPQKSYKEPLLALFICGVACIMLPLLPVAWGALIYLMQNAPINQVSYGKPWELLKAGWAKEGFRMSWIVLPLLCGTLVVTGLRDVRIRQKYLIPALVFMAFIMLLIPYSMGRIDASFSRPGQASLLTWHIFVPLLLIPLVSPVRRAMVLLLCTFFIAGLANEFAPTRNLSALGKPFININPLTDGRANGVPQMGIGMIDAEHLQRTKRLQNWLNETTTSEETFLDLTNRNAQYFYQNRRPPVPVTAPYNMAPLAQQQRAVEILKENPPPVAVFENQNYLHDGYGLALRSPLLYRYALDHYAPAEMEGMIVGYRKLPQEPVTLEQAALYEKAFASRDFGHIALAWGRSDASLQKQMTLVMRLDEMTPETRLSGRDAGLFRFRFSCDHPRTSAPQLRVRFSGNAGSVSIPMIGGTDDLLIVPLDAQPRWLLSHTITDLQVELVNPDDCASVQISEAALYQRNIFLAR